MNAQAPRNGTTWKIATGALTLFLVTTGAMWGMVSVHADTPHEDALTRPEFGMFKDTVDRRLERIENKLDRLLEKE